MHFNEVPDEKGRALSILQNEGDEDEKSVMVSSRQMSIVQ